LRIESLLRRLGTRLAALTLIAILALAGVACGGEDSTDNAARASGGRTEKGAAPESTGQGSETTTEKTDADVAVSGEAAALARAEVGREEITNMLPADGKKPDPARQLPEDPPAGIQVYPATTNAMVRGPIEYDREPPTNGDHAPLWQNCGFYEGPIEDRHAVHSMDHGVIWITYRSNLPAGQLKELRSYGDERYVLTSPYPRQDAPIIAASWRVQLELRGADDPRLRQFVNQLRISELVPWITLRSEARAGCAAGSRAFLCGVQCW
jgi:hypothetical protein